MTTLTRLRAWLIKPKTRGPVAHDPEGLVLMLYRRVQELERERTYLRAALCADRERIVRDIIANDTATAGEP